MLRVWQGIRWRNRVPWPRRKSSISPLSERTWSTSKTITTTTTNRDDVDQSFRIPGDLPDKARIPDGAQRRK